VDSCDKVPPELHGGAPRQSCFERGLGQCWSKGLRETRTHQGRRRNGRGVFIAGVQNNRSEIHGPEMRDVPHSTDTINIVEIVGTWRRLPEEISGSGAGDRKI
jgi:hypothetical protein